MSEPRDLENKAQAGVSFQRDLRLCPSAPDKRRCAQASVLQARGELPPPGSGLRSLAGASPNRPPRPELVQRVGIAGGLSHPDRARRKAVSYRSPECSSPCDPKDTGPRRSRTWGGGRPCPAPRPCTCHQGLFPDDAASGEMPEGPWKREGGLGSHPPPRCRSQQDGIAKGASVLCSCWVSFQPPASLAYYFSPSLQLNQTMVPTASRKQARGLLSQRREVRGRSPVLGGIFLIPHLCTRPGRLTFPAPAP